MTGVHLGKERLNSMLKILIKSLNSMGKNSYAMPFVYESLWSMSLHHTAMVSFTKNNVEVLLAYLFDLHKIQVW